MSFMYSSQLVYSGGYADTERSDTNRYRTVVTMTDPIRIPLTFLTGNAYSSEKWEMFSKPMKAHGDIAAILTI